MNFCGTTLNPTIEVDAKELHCFTYLFTNMRRDNDSLLL